MSRVAAKLLSFSSSILPKGPRIRLERQRIPVFTSPLCTAIEKKDKAARRKKKSPNETKFGQTNLSPPPPASFKGPPLEQLLKRRTRSVKDFNEDFIKTFGDQGSHIPVMLGEVLDVFAPSSSFPQLRSFVDCTLGAGGHSSAIIQAHPELQVLVGLDIDPIAHQKADARIKELLFGNSEPSNSDVKVKILSRNYREIKQAINEADEQLIASGVDGILMDLGMSSMQVDDAKRGFSILTDGPLDMRMNPQATLKAEDIVNFWAPGDIGRILREYGEESNWYRLQNKIVQAREEGGLYSTRELVDLIRSNSRKKEGRQGWIKTASRVFQALRIAVNDELKTLECSISACYDCLRPGGRLAVISFHSLEDRIVKQTFLRIIQGEAGQGGDGEVACKDDMSKRCETLELRIADSADFGNEGWIKQTVKGSSGVILTKRPITASAEEEKLNVRCRSAKLRVLQKA